MTSSAFTAAAADVVNLPSATNDEKLQIYSLYKQATVGDCNTSAPGMFDIAGKAKHNAWKGLAGTSKEDAEAKYVALVESMKAKAK